jgi:hypothetical protein
MSPTGWPLAWRFWPDYSSSGSGPPLQIIGEENPANPFCLGVILIKLGGSARARLRPAGLASAAITTAAATMLVPVIAVIFWPTDFSPGVVKVFLLNGVFAGMFVVSALLFRHAARRAAIVY